MKLSRCAAAVLALVVAQSCGEEGTNLTEPAPTGPSIRAAGQLPSFSVAPPMVLQSYSTDWGEYATGVQPAGWTERWDYTALFEVAAEPSVASGKVLQWSGTGQPRNRWALAYDGFGDVGDQEVSTDFRVRSLGDGSDVYYLGVTAIRISGTADDERGYGLFFVLDTVSKQKTAAVATWVSGIYTELGNIPYDWQQDVWYSIRFQAVGHQIRGRIWPAGTVEPTTWQFDIYDERYATGRPGVFNHDNGYVQWARWTGAVLADTSTPAPPSGVSYATGFTEYAAGTQPSGWTETSAPDNSDWTVVTDATVADARVLRNVTTSTARHILRYDAIGDTTTTQEVLVKMRLGDDDDRGPGIALRHTMDASGHETAYAAYFRSMSDQVEVNAYVAGVWQFIGAAPFVNDPGQWYWMRFRAEGTALKLRVWADGAAEPAVWTYIGSSSAIAAGGVGLYTYEPNTVDYDGFSVATGGLSAPIPGASLPNLPGQPVFSSLSSPSITYGTASVALGGTLLAGSLAPSGNVTVTVGTGAMALTQTSAIQADGSFLAIFNTSSLSASSTPYPVTYEYQANSNFAAASSSATVTITPAAPTVSATGGTFTYDGQPHAGNGSAMGVNAENLGGVALSYSGTGSTSYGPSAAAPSQAGTYAVTASFGGNGNYTAGSSAPAALTVAPRTLTVRATGVNKVYDGTTAAAVALSDDRITGDALTITYSAAFADRNVGTVKPVRVGGILLSGPNAANYTANGTATATADITAKHLTPSFTVANKIYDGTTAATVVSTLLPGVISPDVVTLQVSNAQFQDPNAGTGKVVIASVSIVGADAPNYTVNASATTSANIEQAPATVALANLLQKWDGTSKSATITTNPIGLSWTMTYGQNGAAVVSPTNAGFYDVIATITDRNYAGSASGTLVILNPIDIMPGNSTNVISISDTKTTEIAVAILGTTTFDVSTVASSTVTLGDGVGTDAPVNITKAGALHVATADVNADGRPDLVLYFSKPAVMSAGNVTTATTQLVLLGRLASGARLEGIDKVVVYP